MPERLVVLTLSRVLLAVELSMVLKYWPPLCCSGSQHCGLLRKVSRRRLEYL